MERRLAAILAADVVGYSRLMGVDEVGTHERLKSLHKDLVHPRIAGRGGRIVKLMGDGLLAEFPSVVEAVQCAIEIQQDMAAREPDLSDDHRLRLRIGVNLGDIIREGADIYGDGVNIAARLEGLADPGGICLSGAVYREVKNKLGLAVEDLGEQTFKNIAEPIRVYRVPGDSSADAADLTAASRHPPADRPSIAVLAFRNLSGDPDYFSEGLSEDIVTALSRFRWLTVISPRSSFQFRDSDERDLGRIARDLRVQYLIDGSIRRSGPRLRVVARLTNNRSGSTEWSEKFDLTEGDVLELQDELTRRIVSAVAPASLAAEMQNAQRRPPVDYDAWIEVMRAHWHLRRLTQSDNMEAQKILAAAMDHQPGLAMLASDLAISHVYDALFGWSASRAHSIELADKLARQARSIDGTDALAYTAMGFADHIHGAHQAAVDAFDSALRLNENLAEAHGYLAMTLGFVGDVERVEHHVARSTQLSPQDPMLSFWFDAAAMAAYMARDFELAFQWASRSVAENPNYVGGLRVLAAACGQLNRMDTAHATVGNLLTLDPNMTCEATTQQLPFRSPEDADLYADGLRAAGLP